VGLAQSSTGRTKVAVVLSCNDNGNKLAVKQVQQYADTADFYQNQKRSQSQLISPCFRLRFARGRPTLDLDVTVCGSMILVVPSFLPFFLFWECLLIVNLSKRSKLLKIRKTPRSQALAPQGSRKGEEENTNRHTLKAYVQEDRTGS